MRNGSLSRTPISSLSGLGIAALLLVAAAAGAEPPAPPGPVGARERFAPLDLRDRRARPIQVRFEVSPPDAPGRLAERWGDPIRAWFTPLQAPDRVEIRVGARAMERVLSAYDPVPGSFSDFVWRLDSASGEVRSAAFRGSLRRRVDLGLWDTRVETDIAVDMGTDRRGGFLPARRRFGHLLFEYCGAGDPGCTLVQPRPYDPATGYVNAIGAIQARGLGWMRVTTFSPLGEAIFGEAPASRPDVAAGPG